MTDLPERIDPIYKEIESFEDYEYSNCIAYEMAIRNDEVKRFIKMRNNFILDMDIDIDGEEINNSNELDLINKLEKHYLIGIDICSNIRKIYSKYLKENKDYDAIDAFYSNIEKYEFSFDRGCYDAKKVHLNSRELAGTFDKGILLLDFKKDEENATIEDKDFLYFKRPRLLVPKDINKEIFLRLNFNLPKEELAAYILKIKDEFDKDNSIIKSPLELLGKKLDKANKVKSKSLPKDKNKRKKAMANAFYVYDMYKILEQEYSIKIDNLKVERDTQIKNIKLSKNYDRQEKESMIQEIKEEYNYLLEQYSKTSIKTEINLQSGLSIDDIERYKALMNKYIDELKYKELITGISN